MKKFLILNFFIFFSLSSYAENSSFFSGEETIVFFRHGEKPSSEIGQLNCQGLNRSLLLPNVLANKFGLPNYLFAPNPSGKMIGLGGLFFYIRPLATIEPTAIKFNLPVNLSYTYLDIKGIASELLEEKYKNSTVYVAWEHVMLPEIVKAIYVKGNKNPFDIPSWESEDYDSIYVLKISKDLFSTKNISFYKDYEGLNGITSSCP